MHVVSENLKDRHPYVEPDFKDRYDPSEVSKIFKEGLSCSIWPFHTEIGGNTIAAAYWGLQIQRCIDYFEWNGWPLGNEGSNDILR